MFSVAATHTKYLGFFCIQDILFWLVDELKQYKFSINNMFSTNYQYYTSIKQDLQVPTFQNDMSFAKH